MTEAHIPFSVEAEQALLGILLFDPALLADVGGLRAIDFYDGLHQRVYAAIVNLSYGGGKVTGEAVAVRLANEPDFVQFGGEKFLRAMANNAPSSLMLAHYVGLIVDMSSRRDVIRLCEATRAAAMDGSLSAESLINTAEAQLGVIAAGAGVSDHWMDTVVLCESVDRVLAGEVVAYVSSGLKPYDRAIGGLQHGRMNVWAARPKMGKTGVSVVQAYNIANAGFGVGMFSLEMGHIELAMRMACCAAYEQGAPDNPQYFLAAKNELSHDARLKMAAGARKLRDLPLHIDDRAGMRPSQVAPAAKKLIRQWERNGIKPGLIVVDHLTIMRPDGPNGNKVAEVSEVSGALRDLARDTDVTFLVLCQLSRAVESRDDKRPQLSDLRWSGEVEQDAAQVTFLYRHERYLQEPRGDNYSSPEWLAYADEKARWANRIELINTANRMGPSATVEMGIDLGCNAMWEV